MTAKPALSSAPRIVVPSETIYLSIIDGFIFCPGTAVSICDVNSISGIDSLLADVSAKLQIKLLAQCPVFSALSSSITYKSKWLHFFVKTLEIVDLFLVSEFTFTSSKNSLTNLSLLTFSVNKISSLIIKECFHVFDKVYLPFCFPTYQ